MMWKDVYLENLVMAASPLELIRMLYLKAIETVQSARRHLAAGDIAGRSKAISHAIAIVAELNASLNHSVEGNISRELEALYTYIRQRLTEANLRQQEPPLAEVQSLLTTLAEAWQRTDAPDEKSARAHPEPALPSNIWEASEASQLHTWSA